MNLTKHFKVAEFAVSKDHPELARDMVITDTIKLRLKLLCESILEPIRNGKENKSSPIKILSGYRDPNLNESIGGAKDSDHKYGIASDLAFKGDLEQTSKVFQEVIKGKLPYRQIIFYPDNNFIHVSINIPGRDFKNEALIKTEDGYEPYTAKAIKKYL